jgi:hypothetical protein
MEAAIEIGAEDLTEEIINDERIIKVGYQLNVLYFCLLTYVVTVYLWC